MTSLSLQDYQHPGGVIFTDALPETSLRKALDFSPDAEIVVQSRSVTLEEIEDQALIDSHEDAPEIMSFP